MECLKSNFYRRFFYGRRIGMNTIYTFLTIALISQKTLLKQQNL